MRQPRDQWPTTQDFTGAKIPDEDLRKVVHVACAVIGEALIDIQRFKGRSYNLLIRVVATVMKIARQRTFRPEHLTAEDLDTAEKFCIQQSMRYTTEELQKGKLKSLRPEVDGDGVVVLSSRAAEGFRLHYGTDRLPILAYGDPLALLWMKKVHEDIS